MSFPLSFVCRPGARALVDVKAASYATLPSSTNAFDLDFGDEDCIGMRPCVPFVSSEGTAAGAYIPPVATTGAMPAEHDSRGEPRGIGSPTITSTLLPTTYACASMGTSEPTLSPYAESRAGNRGARPIDGPSSGSNSGTASDFGAGSQATSGAARAVVYSTPGAPSRKPPSTAGGAASRNKSFFEKITCLPEDNFNVLTPDKHVMLSIPVQFIVPTNGSRNYLKKNRGMACTAEGMHTHSHGNTVLCGTGDAQAPREKKMFFSFCLCKSFSAVGGRCHHGAECDFIHCLPERLPQVVSTDSGSVIDEIIEKKNLMQRQQQAARGRGVVVASASPTLSPQPAAAPPVVGQAGEISSFQVHWSTPVASLDACPYARLPAGRVIYIKREGSRNNLQALPSELIYKTIGGVEAGTDVGRRGLSAHGGPHPGDAAAPLRICKHYEREKCARGPLCHFIHPVVLVGSGAGDSLRPTVASERMGRTEAVEVSQQPRQLVAHPREYRGGPGTAVLPGGRSERVESRQDANLSTPFAAPPLAGQLPPELDPLSLQQLPHGRLAAPQGGDSGALVCNLFSQLAAMDSSGGSGAIGASFASLLCPLFQQQQVTGTTPLHSVVPRQCSDGGHIGPVSGFCPAPHASVGGAPPPGSMLFVPQERGVVQVYPTTGMMPSPQQQQQQMCQLSYLYPPQ